MGIDIPLILLSLTAIFCALDDVLVILIAKRIGGKLGLGLRIIGIGLFSILMYMVIDLVVIYFGWLNLIYYLVVHYVVETLSYIPIVIGLWLIFETLRRK